MKTFLTLFKYERRSLFPSLNLKKKPDIIGWIFSVLISALVIGLSLFMVSAIAKNYVEVRLDKISDPIARSTELLTSLYLIIIVVLTFTCLEKMRNTLASKEGKEIFLRLPVSSKTMFISKLLALMLWNYTASIFLILPINAIFYLLLDPGMTFLINTALVVVFLPMVSFLLATLLLIPYFHIVNFLSRHFLLTLVAFSSLLIGAFYLYSKVLDVIRRMLETGSIKFLFNQDFVEFLQATEKYAYPANLLSGMAFGKNMLLSILILSAVAVISFIVALFITKALYKITMYNTSAGKVRRGKRHIMPRSPMISLIRKEFISVFRNPKHLFSYFSIAMAMPFMIYCCYTLFNALLLSAIGRSFELALTVLVLLVFGILTNTFCATNITRDGPAALKAKIFPMRPSLIILSKIIFCDIVSSLSVIASGLLLHFMAGVSMKSALVASGIGLIFSLSQIFIATRMDLNHARVAGGPAEAEKSSNRTIAKTISLGLLFAIIIGFVSLFTSLFSGTAPGFLGGFKILPIYSTLFPLIISALYLLFSALYCFVNVKKAFNKLVR